MDSTPKSKGHRSPMGFVCRLHDQLCRRILPWCLVMISCTLWIFLSSNSRSDLAFFMNSGDADQCSGRYVYVHDIPSRFNTDLIGRPGCHALSKWKDMCDPVSNGGLGQPLDNSDGVFSDRGWYKTNQFTLEIIFHGRMKQYECLTNDSSMASAIYVPFYAGLDVGRYFWGFNNSVRDSLSLDLLRWLKAAPQWKAMGGKDHFMVVGRTSWELRRVTGIWGGKILNLPETKNMTVLIIESSPWHSNDVAIPYPTYFHPSRDAEVLAWQDRMRTTERPWLFSFAGAPRPNSKDSIRDQIIGQCSNSSRCTLLKCGLGPSKCHSPSSVMKMFQSSVFCLQPPGDTFSRRSTFDSMVAGCIPVFFHPGSAYVQYTWYLPTNYSKYSVFISQEEVKAGKAKIEEVLKRFSEQEVSAMRDEVIRIMPTLIYRDQLKLRTTENSMKDAFDVAVEGVIGRIGEKRRIIKQGLAFPEFKESDSWKRALGWTSGKHEWDSFFMRAR